jgi:hypothetical protein
MERRQIGLKLVMDDLCLDIKLENFEDRLILQKATYLAQAAGVNLGYYYRWYLRGPYCPAVAEDGFAIKAEPPQGIDETKNWALDAGSAAKLKRIRAMMAVEPREELAKKLELFASAHFLVDRRQVSGRDPRAIARTLRRFEKFFTEQEVAAALQEMASCGIIP